VEAADVGDFYAALGVEGDHLVGVLDYLYGQDGG
jgi:hypothetical protein